MQIILNWSINIAEFWTFVDYFFFCKFSILEFLFIYIIDVAKCTDFPYYTQLQSIDSNSLLELLTRMLN